MSKYARLIEVVQKPGIGHELYIDGKLFPWLLSEKGVATTALRDESPGVTITIPAYAVRFLHSLNFGPDSAHAIETDATKIAEFFG